jgi:hypothetical protein
LRSDSLSVGSILEETNPNSSFKMCKRLSEERPPREKVKATLHLEDGSKFEGYSFGANIGVGGEVGRYFYLFVIS